MSSSKIPYSGNFKIFNGIPNDIIPNLEDAIKGTFDNNLLPNSADSKNLLNLINNSKLELFDPKRTSLPTDILKFRGYPKPSISISVTYEGYNNTNNTVLNKIQINFNNKVGFDYNVITFFDSTNWTPENSAPTIQIQSGLQNNFEIIEIPESTTLNGKIGINSNNDYYIVSPNQADLLFQPPIIYNFTHSVYFYGGTTIPSCPTSDQNYSPYLNRFSNDNNLEVGSKLYNTNRANSTFVTNGIYVQRSFEVGYKFLKVVSGEITEITNCSPPMD